ncbi:putative uncharacterized protein [Coprococcus sp. CAG:782]|nr:putative uncharacterized protein [Coprococcus sp. CAG:782]
MSTQEVGKYRQFFDVDEKYFPCIDDSAIEAGAPWENTYPHETFIELLKNVETMLGGTTKRSVWIHGAYGTGKSQCAYALKKILEVPEEELKAYWNQYEALKNNPDLLSKILGHKERGVVTAYRYASGGITTPRDLYYAIQESVKKALIENPQITYLGENTLKESVIAWIKDHKEIFDILLKKPEWVATFSQSTSDEVINTLEKSADVKSLMDNIFKLADKEGITAMSLDGDKLKAWLKDVIEKNNTKIVLVWDEFSGFFKQNRNSLDEFQKIVALCQEAPFYFIVVTHQTESIINSDDSTWKVVQQRFNFSQISLPDNIAFNLIGHAFNVKPAAQEMWNICADDLNTRLSASRSAVMKAARISDPKVVKDIMPIHPMTALILKNIAVAFQSNQRSMFDFIKIANADDTQAFQWFIEKTGPSDDHPLLTVDMLWDFFYVKGRDNLTADIRMILDTYPQQQNLREDEKRVLKTILIMQAIDKRLGGMIELLKPTEQNISYVYEGITSGLDTQCKNIAKALATKGILVTSPIGNNKYAYGAAVLAGDQAKIDEFKKTIKQNSTTAKLISEGNLDTVLSLPPALKLRYEMTPGCGNLVPVTNADFTRKINELKDAPMDWHFIAVVALAKDDSEAISLRKLVKEAAQNDDYSNIVFIDALSTPLGEDEFDAYIDFAAMSQYYQGNPKSATENKIKAQQVLAVTWKNRIYNGSFTIYHADCREGEKVIGGQAVADVLQTIVTTKFKYVFDFNRGVNENQLKVTQLKSAAKCGIVKATSGVMSRAEKSVLAEVWEQDNYWTNPTTSGLNISIIKRDIEALIDENFKKEGQISIDDIYSHLESDYGFAPCNLSAFLLGFMLKEYGGEPYRYLDSSGSHDVMSSDKLSEMIGNYINGKSNPTYIVKMTPEEMAFYEVTEKAWGLEPNACAHINQAQVSVRNKMQYLRLPVWSLKNVDDAGVYDFVEKYIELIQKEGKEAHKVALSIGSASVIKPSLGENLAKLLTPEKCQEGMKYYLQAFEDGKLLSLASEIGAEETMLADISHLFSVAYSSLWNSEMGEAEIRKLIVDYTFVKETNTLLNCNAHSKAEAFEKWREKLEFAMCSHEALEEKFASLKEVYSFLFDIVTRKDILPDQMEKCTQSLCEQRLDVQHYFDNEVGVFYEIYKAYLDDISVEEAAQLKVPRLINVFRESKTESNALVKQLADEFRKNQTKTKLFNLWKEKTNSKTPRDWSYMHRTPILLMVSKEQYDEAKKAFEVLNRTMATEKEIDNALLLLENAKFYDDLGSEEKINHAFSNFLGRYKGILKDIDKVRDALERLSVETYEWDSHPAVKTKIEELAKAEYDAGGSDAVVSKIENMSSDDLKSHLIKLIKNNMNIGVEIINEGE